MRGKRRSERRELERVQGREEKEEAKRKGAQSMRGRERRRENEKGGDGVARDM